MKNNLEILGLNKTENNHNKNNDIILNKSKLNNQNRLNIQNLREKFKLHPKDIENYKPVWLIENFLSKESLVSIYSKAGKGKSFFVLYLSIMLLESKLIDGVIYFDGDNGMGQFARRNLNYILEKYENFEYFVTFNLKNPLEFLDKRRLISDLLYWEKSELENKLIVIDSIRDFMRGDMTKDKDVIPVLENLKSLRSKGATIIFLHHQTKQKNGENDKTYKGATSFEDSVDEAYFLENKTASYNNNLSDNIILTLEPQKRRDKTNSYAFSIDVKNFKIEILDYELYSMSQKELMTLSYVCEIINENPSGIVQSKLARKLQKIAREDYVEIVGLNALWNLLKKNNNKKFIIEKIRGQGRSGYTNFYKPL